MQFEEYLPLIQAQWLQFYQFTLENPLYAGALALSVWLVTAILYGFRIGSLNRRNRKSLQVITTTQTELTEVQAQVQQLQEAQALLNQQLEQESLRAGGLQTRIAELSTLLSENILELAAQPALGQQGLTVNPALTLEQLWQRFSIAVKQLSESLIAEKDAYRELKQTLQTETAKLAEQELQLQAAQLRVDNQKQQINKLEEVLAEHDQILVQQQDSAQQRIAAIEAKYQTNLLRLAELEQQALEWRKQPAAPITPAVATAPVVPEVTQPATAEPTISAVIDEPVVQPAPPVPQQTSPVKPLEVITPAASVMEQAIVQAAEPSPAAEAPAPAAGKFKSLFANARQKIDLLDQKLGSRSSQNQEINQAAAHYDAIRQPEPPAPPVVETPAAPVVEPEPAPVQAAAPSSKASAAAKPEASKFGAIFSNARQKISKLDSLLGPPADAAAPAEPEAQAAPETVIEAAPAAQPVAAEAKPGLGGKFKGLLGSKAAKPAKEVASEAEPAVPVAEPSAVPAEPAETGSTKLKGLLGKLKR
ncbi:hypothetical protein KEF85_05370 [Methylomonas paludis]|uniref:Uncharacterized protein n=1 Tax=Methylomonas paludis TaxID=1173101 RepID=A0A975MQZ8_9GAMM|nr:hypothetical protein [Methylomonas paludis]QWF71889.1 hypothetical protein KEF85_05370 [Methylomonas paludis]